MTDPGDLETYEMSEEENEEYESMMDSYYEDIAVDRSRGLD